MMYLQLMFFDKFVIKNVNDVLVLHLKRVFGSFCIAIIATTNLAFFAAIGPRIFGFLTAKNLQPYNDCHSVV